MGLRRSFELRNVSAIELEVTRGGQGTLHVRGESDGNEPIAFAPDEQGRWLEPGQTRPEPLRAVRFLDVDLACRRIEGHAPARREVGAQEFVDARLHPVGSATGMIRCTTASTAQRGVSWTSPSSGRSRRTSGAQGRSRRQASEGDNITSRRTRSGWRRPSSRATRPPMLLPITCARSSSRASSKCMTERAKNGAWYAARSGLTESPNPGRSRAIKRNESASAATVGRNEPLVAPRPWISTTGSPAPAVRMDSSPEAVSNPLKAQPRRPGDAAGRREQPDPQVEIVTNDEAAGAIRGHPAAQVVRDALPGLTVGAEGRVSLQSAAPRS